MTKEAAKARRWEQLLAADTARYGADPLWSSNGIISNVGCEDHPWMCQYCAKVFSSLHDCIAHCATAAHQNNLWYPYTANDLQLPAVPQWTTTGVNGAAHAQICLMDGGSSNSGGAPSRATPSERPSPAADLQDRSSTASARTSSVRVRLDNATFNGHLIQNAVLVVSDPCAGEPPPDADYVMTDTVICGDLQAVPPPFFPRPQMRAGGLVVGDPSSSHRPMAQPGLASATSDAPAQASSWQPTNGCHLAGLTAMLTNRLQPWMAHPKPPPPRPIEGAQAGDPGQSAASARASGWRRRRRPEHDGTSDSGDS